MIRDLLNPSSGYLDLREDSKGVVVAGLSEMTASTTKEVMQMLSLGNKQRTCEPTAVNKTSSRSHAVLQVSMVIIEIFIPVFFSNFLFLTMKTF